MKYHEAPNRTGNRYDRLLEAALLADAAAEADDFFETGEDENLEAEPQEDDDPAGGSVD